eukprot:6179012-Pleurochrysis_carterae.AAC.1
MAMFTMSIITICPSQTDSVLGGHTFTLHARYDLGGAAHAFARAQPRCVCAFITKASSRKRGIQRAQ